MYTKKKISAAKRGVILKKELIHIGYIFLADISIK